MIRFNTFGADHLNLWIFVSGVLTKIALVPVKHQQG